MITRVRMDGQRRIRIPKKAGLKGDTFLLLALGTYHIIFPVPEEKPQLEIDGPIAELLAQAEEEASQDISKRWKGRGLQTATKNLDNHGHCVDRYLKKD